MPNKAHSLNNGSFELFNEFNKTEFIICIGQIFSFSISVFWEVNFQ